MKILIVNDDGIQSGLLTMLARSFAARGHQVTVCAPLQQQSAKAHSFTILDMIRVRPCSVDGADAAWAVEGTPADCTRVGLKQLCPDGVDLVVSGINYGYNTGLATYVSGTVGAAREAAFEGYPAMALSIEPPFPEDTARFFSDWCVTVAEHILTQDLPKSSVVNLNCPNLPVAELKDPVVCPLCPDCYNDQLERRVSPRGDIYFWPLYEGRIDPTPGTDRALVEQGHITCTVLTVEPCDQAQFADLLADL